MKVGDIVVLVDAKATLMHISYQGQHFKVDSLDGLDGRFLTASAVGCKWGYPFYLKKSCIRPLTPLEKALL